MRVDWAIPCRAAHVEDGLITIAGAQVDTLYTPTFPSLLATWVAIRLVFSDTELPCEQELAMRLTGPELEELVELRKPLSFGEANPQKAPGWEGSHVMAHLVRFEAPCAGAYTLDIMLGDRHQRTLPFSVRPLEQHQPVQG